VALPPPSPGTFLVFSILFNYVSVVCTPPGSTSSDAPSGDEPHPPHGGSSYWADDDSGVRQCKKCQRHKPPRAHHCSVCKRCVLKMDHHCPWVNNCVGLHNYRFFYCFLLWTVVGTAYVAALLAPSMLLGPKPLLRTALHPWKHHRRALVDTGPTLNDPAAGAAGAAAGAAGAAAGAGVAFPGHSHRPLTTLQFVWALLAALRAEPYVLVVIFALSSSIAFAVGLLLTLHTYLVVTAQTTIEFAMSLQIRGKLRSEGRRYISPYDRGLATNLKMVFGYAAPWYVVAVTPKHFPPPPALPPVPPAAMYHRRPETV